MCERLLRQSDCLHSQSPPQKLCVDDESLDSLVLVRTGAAINEGASQPRRSFTRLSTSDNLHKCLQRTPFVQDFYLCKSMQQTNQNRSYVIRYPLSHVFAVT